MAQKYLLRLPTAQGIPHRQLLYTQPQEDGERVPLLCVMLRKGVRSRSGGLEDLGSVDSDNIRNIVKSLPVFCLFIFFTMLFWLILEPWMYKIEVPMNFGQPNNLIGIFSLCFISLLISLNNVVSIENTSQNKP